MDTLSQITTTSKVLAVLIDPDKSEDQRLSQLAQLAQQGEIQLFLVGGSLVQKDRVRHIVEYLKERCQTPVFIFPGNPSQVYSGADGLLLLSLISGRNPDLLIGRHVESAFMIKNSGLPTTPTGYILIDGGTSTSVSYMSNTTPIPANKADIAVATALAGELLGMKAIYLEAGSGASQAVPLDTIRKVRENIQLPIFVGGGIKNKEQVQQAFDAGADIVVVGTAIENNSNWFQNP